MESSAGSAKSGVCSAWQSKRSAGLHLYPVLAPLLRWAIRPAACFLLSFSTAYASGWVSTTQPDAPNAELCQALLYRLNHTSADCILAAAGTYPGFTSPPWEMIDASKHIELIAKLKYVGGPGWQENLQKTPPPNWEHALEGAKEFVQEGGTLQIWHTRMFEYFGADREDPAPPGNQTITLLSTKQGSRAIPACPASASFRWSRAFVVLPDLSGPDLRVQTGPAALLRDDYPVLYKGQTLLVNNALVFDPVTHELGEYSRVIIYSTGSGPAGGCWLEYHG